MKITKYIRLLPYPNGRGVVARGHVLQKDPKEAPVSMTIHVHNPPVWLRKMERKRGVFSRLPIDLHLYLDHTGNWTDAYTMEHFKIV